jgi:hypothetical protein
MCCLSVTPNVGRRRQKKAAEAAPNVRSIAPMKWEYHFFPIATGQPQVETEVNGLGRDGWELVLSYINPTGTTFLVFKRPAK